MKLIARVKLSNVFLSPAFSLWFLSSSLSQSSLMLCMNFQIKTFYLTGNSNPTGTCLPSCAYHPIMGGDFFAQDFLWFVFYSRGVKASVQLTAAKSRGKAGM